jgi:hypothetical protein
MNLCYNFLCYNFFFNFLKTKFNLTSVSSVFSRCILDIRMYIPCKKEILMELL